MSDPVIRTALPGPKAKAIIDRDSTVVSPSYTRGYPLVIERGSGCMVEDVDGNVFLDCAAGIAVNATGHSHPEVVKAIRNGNYGFHDPVLNVYFCHFAGDSSDDGTMWVYRYRNATK